METIPNPVEVQPPIQTSRLAEIGSAVLALILGTGIFYIGTFLRTINSFFLFMFYGDNNTTWFVLVIIEFLISVLLFIVPFIASGYFEYRVSRKYKLPMVIIGLILNPIVLIASDYRMYQQVLAIQTDPRYNTDVHTKPKSQYSFSEYFIGSSFPVIQIEGPEPTPKEIIYNDAPSLDVPPLPATSVWSEYTGPRFASVSVPYHKVTSNPTESTSDVIQMTGKLFSADASYEEVIRYGQALDKSGWFYAEQTPEINGVSFTLQSHAKSSVGDTCPIFRFPESIMGLQNGKMRLVLLGFLDSEKCPVTTAREIDKRYIFISDITDFTTLPAPEEKSAAQSVSCPPHVQLPTGYRYQDPVNSFFGLTLKDGEGKICDVVLGPNYTASHEGYSGEQIQINVYQIAGVTPEKIMLADGGKLRPTSPDRLRYSRSGYGGENDVLIYRTSDRYVQIIWREWGTTMIEPIVNDIVLKLQTSL